MLTKVLPLNSDTEMLRILSSFHVALPSTSATRCAQEEEAESDGVVATLGSSFLLADDDFFGAGFGGGFNFKVMVGVN